MSGIVKVALPVAQKAWPLLVAHWPKVVEAALLLSAFVKKHPELPEWFKARVSTLQEGFAMAAKKRTPSGQIQATLAVIRHDLDRGGDGLDPGPWLARADAIERGVRLAERLEGSAKKSAFVDLKSLTDGLAGDLMVAVLRTQSPAGGASRD